MKLPTPKVDKDKLLERRKRFWKNLFYTHDRMKLYYVQITYLLLLAFPLRFVFNLYMWVEIFSSQESIDQFLLVFYVFLALVGLVCVIVYFAVWRFIFPKYIIIRGKSRYPAGRAYWYTSGGIATWSIKKRAWAGCPVDFDKPYIWVCLGLFNPFNPRSCMTRFWLPQGTKFIREPTELRVWEPYHKRMEVSSDGSTEFILDGDEHVFASGVENDGVRGIGDHKLREMIICTQKASQASIPHIQRALEHGSFDMSWGTKEEIERTAKEKGVVFEEP